MRISVQLVVRHDDHDDGDEDGEEVVAEVLTLSRDELGTDTVGLHLAEAKALLAAVQQAVASEQVTAALHARENCPGCGLRHRHKDSRTVVVRTLFGSLRLPSPRWWHCGCTPNSAATFSPLAALLHARATPELVYLQARFAAVASLGAGPAPK